MQINSGFKPSMLARIVQDGGGLIRILSPQNAIRYFLMCLVKLPVFIKNRKLDQALVDRTFQQIITVKYKGIKIKVDCPKIDGVFKEMTSTFSGIREMYARDVYLKYFDLSKIKFGTVIDAGGNRGLFTIFSAYLAERVIWIEFQDYNYHPALASLIVENEAKGEIIEIGALLAGACEKQQFQSEIIKAYYLLSENAKENLRPQKKTTLVSMKDIIKQYDVGRISFLKMDIEGGEFSVMQDSADWIGQVDNIAMEVHPDCGDPRDIVKLLERNGFRVIPVNAELKPTSALAAIYIYASSTGAINLH